MHRRLLVLLAGLALAGLVAAACGGEEKAAPTSAPAATAKPAATAAPTAAPTKAPEPTKPPPTATAAPTQAPTATAKPAGPTGNLVIGDTLIPPPGFLPSKQGTANEHLYIFWGILEPLMWAKYSAPPVLNVDASTYTEGIVEAFQVAPDTSKVTFKIRKGVLFHRGWGELKAQDVCWTFSNAQQPGSVNYRAATVGVFAKGWTCPDDSTVIMDVVKNTLDPNWFRALSNTALGAISIVPKRLYDEKGEEAAHATEAGTGPFESVEWVSNDHITARPVENHYRQTARIASFKMVLMPETATRIAALKTGQIHAARIPVTFIKSARDSVPGSRTKEVGPPINQVFFFGGNYWADKDPATGEDIYRKRQGFKPDAQHPWIGDPADPASMEKARKVRLALSLAIDRNAIVQELQAGIGKPLYTMINSFPGDAAWKPEWAIPYDPAKAKQLLTEAGYPNCFSFKVWIAPGKEWNPDVGGAVTQFWRTLGCTVEVDATEYAAGRPLQVSRARDNPWMIHSGSGATLDAVNAAVGRPSSGFNLGIEVPNEITEVGMRNLDVLKTTFEQRVKNNQVYQDYFSTWNLFAPVTVLPLSFLLRPEVVDWNPYMNGGAEFVAPETVVMSK